VHPCKIKGEATDLRKLEAFLEKILKIKALALVLE
jgi:hypothetical protein